MLSEPWCKMADLVGRIAAISEMEARLPKESANATLWECEEVALRYVMEDGKLNLCLRNIVEFWAFLRDADVRSAALAAAPPAYAPSRGEAKGGDESWQREKLDVFEKGMGVMLRNAWSHVEAVQTTDLPLLVKHIADVLAEAVTPAGANRLIDQVERDDLRDRQSVVVLSYLRALCIRSDDLATLRFMTIVRDENLVERLVSYLDAHHNLISAADLLMACQALSCLVDSEDFQTYEKQYLPSAARATLGSFRSAFLEQFLDDYDNRKTIQPLLRFIQDCSFDNHK